MTRKPALVAVVTLAVGTTVLQGGLAARAVAAPADAPTAPIATTAVAATGTAAPTTADPATGSSTSTTSPTSTDASGTPSSTDAATSATPSSPASSQSASPTPSPTSLAMRMGTTIAQENAFPGTSDWYVPAPAIADSTKLAGYTTTPSVLPGQPVSLKVDDKTGSQHRLSVYRIGYYGGLGGRLVRQGMWESGVSQPAPDVDPTTYRVSARAWSVTDTFDTTGWLPGAYIIMLETSDGLKSPIPFVVRSPDVTGRTVIVTAPSTWQAYNRYGGHSAYYGLVPGTTSPAWSGAFRSRVVSFDRPYDRTGVDHFWEMEQGGVYEAERSGVEVAYTTDTDIAASGANPYLKASALFHLGHDEYWSNGYADTMKTLRDHGVNLVFSGGNSMWWRVRYDADMRGMSIYKVASEDPVKTADQSTVTFTDQQAAALLGSHYNCWGVNGDFTVSDPDFFLFKGTGATKGQAIPNLLREEVDQAINNDFTPATEQIAGHSTYTCTTGGRTPTTNTQDFTYYTAASGAGVVNMSNMGFNILLSPQETAARHQAPQATIDFARTVFDNALKASAAGPMGRSNPARPNVHTYYKTVLGNRIGPCAGCALAGTGLCGDFSGDQLADVLGVADNGDLRIYPTAANGTSSAPHVVSTGWDGIDWIGVVPDMNGDKQSDVLARGIDGTLWLYQGFFNGLAPKATRVGTGWGGLSLLTVVPDLTGHGSSLLLGRNAAGQLLSYTIDPHGLRSNGQVGHGWNSIRLLAAVNDITGDGKPDLQAVRSDGTLWTYTIGDHSVNPGHMTGHGWGGFTALFSPGDLNHDGRWDLVGRTSSGDAFAYRNTGRGWGRSLKMAQGWNSLTTLA